MDYSNQQNYPPQIPGQGTGKTIIYVISAAAIIVIAVLIFVLVSLKDKEDSASDENQSAPKEKKSAVRETSPPPPVTKSNQEIEIEVKSAAIRFLKLWSDKDLSGLNSMLADDYQYETAKGINKYQDKSERLSVWSEQFAQRRFISVTGENINVSVSSPNTAVFTYSQVYLSDQYSDSGLKVLHFRNENGVWKIFKDSFY